MSVWHSQKLGDVCDVLDSLRRPITKRDRVAGPFPYYGATGIVDYVGDFIFDEKLVLVGEDGAKWQSGEETAFVVEGKCWVNNHAHVLRPKRDRLIDEWLAYYLTHLDLSPWVGGLTVPKLNQGNLRDIPVPLPPLTEQNRLVAILEEALEGIAKATANADRNLANARELFVATRAELLTEAGNNWPERPFESICVLQRGFDLPKQDRKPGPFPLVSSSGPIDFHSEGPIKAPGVAVGRSGSVGRTFFVEHDFWPLNTVLYVKEFFHNDPEYVFHLLDHMNLAQYAGGAGVPTLNRNVVHVVPVRVPESLEIQKVVVTKLTDAAMNSTSLIDAYKGKLALLRELRKSLFHKAFSGQLTDKEAKAA